MYPTGGISIRSALGHSLLFFVALSIQWAFGQSLKDRLSLPQFSRPRAILDSEIIQEDLDRPMIDQELYGTYFKVADGFSSKLIIHNQRSDALIGVTPVLLADGREIVLETEQVQPSSSIVIDLNQALASMNERRVRSGGVILRYRFPTMGPLDATIAINHSADRLSLMAPVKERQQFMSNKQEGVFWMPYSAAESFLAIQNTSLELRHIDIATFLKGGFSRRHKVTVQPHSTLFVSFKDLLRFSRASAVLDSEVIHTDLDRLSRSLSGAFEVLSDGQPGDIIVEGALVNHAKHFSKRISFLDPSLEFFNRKIYANFVFFESAPQVFNFPRGVSFHPVLVMHNASDEDITVRPVFKAADGVV